MVVTTEAAAAAGDTTPAHNTGADIKPTTNDAADAQAATSHQPPPSSEGKQRPNSVSETSTCTSSTISGQQQTQSQKLPTVARRLANRPEPLKFAPHGQETPLDLSVKSAGFLPSSGAMLTSQLNLNSATSQTLETPRIFWQDSETLLKSQPQFYRSTKHLYHSSNNNIATRCLLSASSSLLGDATPPITPASIGIDVVGGRIGMDLMSPVSHWPLTARFARSSSSSSSLAGFGFGGAGDGSGCLSSAASGLLTPSARLSGVLLSPQFARTSSAALLRSPSGFTSGGAPSNASTTTTATTTNDTCTDGEDTAETSSRQIYAARKRTQANGSNATLTLNAASVSSAAANLFNIRLTSPPAATDANDTADGSQQQLQSQLACEVSHPDPRSPISSEMGAATSAPISTTTTTTTITTTTNGPHPSPNTLQPRKPRDSFLATCSLLGADTPTASAINCGFAFPASGAGSGGAVGSLDTPPLPSPNTLRAHSEFLASPPDLSPLSASVFELPSPMFAAAFESCGLVRSSSGAGKLQSPAASRFLNQSQQSTTTLERPATMLTKAASDQTVATTTSQAASASSHQQQLHQWPPRAATETNLAALVTPAREKLVASMSSVPQGCCVAAASEQMDVDEPSLDAEADAELRRVLGDAEPSPATALPERSASAVPRISVSTGASETQHWPSPLPSTAADCCCTPQQQCPFLSDNQADQSNSSTLYQQQVQRLDREPVPNCGLPQNSFGARVAQYHVERHESCSAPPLVLQRVASANDGAQWLSDGSDGGGAMLAPANYPQQQLQQLQQPLQRLTPSFSHGQLAVVRNWQPSHQQMLQQSQSTQHVQLLGPPTSATTQLNNDSTTNKAHNSDFALYCGPTTALSPFGVRLSDDSSALDSRSSSLSLQQSPRSLQHPSQQNQLASPSNSKTSQSAGRRFRCNDCGKSFTRSDMLTRHRRLHSGDRPFHCGECKQEFSRSDHLATHMRTHTGEKPYRCKLCPYTACRKDMITRHMKVHGKPTSAAAHAMPLKTN